MLVEGMAPVDGIFLLWMSWSWTVMIMEMLNLGRVKKEKMD